MADSKKIMEELAVITGQDRFKTDPADTAPYRLDGVVPQAVVFPSHTKMVAEIVKCACRGHLAVVPWGSGTKMAMGNNPKSVDLVVCTSRLNHMLDVDTANLTITVEAGVKFRDIQARLATEEDRCYLPLDDLKTEAGEFICSDRSHSGSFLPLDPPFSEKATIGGIVAANSSGPRRLLYGLPRDLVLGVRFVTPTGDIVGAGGKTVKNVSGFDISKLMIGSLGSLGILCEITLRLLPLPENMETLVFTFDSWSDASGFATALLATKLLPAAVEVCNRAALDQMDFRSDLKLSCRAVRRHGSPGGLPGGRDPDAEGIGGHGGTLQSQGADPHHRRGAPAFLAGGRRDPEYGVPCVSRALYLSSSIIPFPRGRGSLSLPTRP